MTDLADEIEYELHPFVVRLDCTGVDKQECATWVADLLERITRGDHRLMMRVLAALPISERRVLLREMANQVADWDLSDIRMIVSDFGGNPGRFDDEY
jgi:hypothetical protein